MFTQPLATVGNVIVTFGLLGFLGIIVHSMSDADNGRQ
jgi:hypothetical protein